MQPGERISTYRILAPLGHGGMGAVYRALDEAAKREVALKVLAAPWPDAELRRRFEREGRALAAVDHAHVVRVFAAGVDRANRPWLALELAPGGSLEALRRERGGRLPWREAARLGAQVARGLSALHAAGLVHRDLKPANVLIGDDGAAKVTDLGLVRADAATGLTRGGLTRTGEVMGTVAFMAPEQVDGASGVDARADLYALGATLHALISGRPPFDDQGWALVEKVLHAPPAPLRSLAPDTPPALEALVLRLLAKAPSARPASADEVAHALDHLATARDAGRRPGRGVVVAIAAAVTAALLGVAWSTRPAERPGGPATAGAASRPPTDPRPEAVAVDPPGPPAVVTGPRKLGEGTPRSACFLADGRVVLARPDRLELWSASTGEPLGVLAPLPADGALLCPDPDGGLVVARGDAVWRVSATGEVTGPRRAPSRVTSVAAAPDALVLVGTERQAWLDLLPGTPPRSRTSSPGTSSPCTPSRSRATAAGHPPGPARASTPAASPAPPSCGASSGVASTGTRRRSRPCSA